MTTIVTIDKAGRVVIPIHLREQMNLSAGDELALEAEGESVTLRPKRESMRMHKKKGVWVFNGGGRLTVEDVNRSLKRDRDERGRRDFGPDDK